MNGDLGRDAEDQEPELRAIGNAPIKKPLSEFLAEFEERLATHPDEPATGALRAVEDRAAGVRRSSPDTSPTRHTTAETEAPGPETVPKALPYEVPAPAEVIFEKATEVTPAEGSGESRRLRGRRRRKHRHRAH